MMATFLASTLSHIYLPDLVNKFFRKLDQAFIYLMIVGSFSPFALTFMRTPLWLVFYTVVVIVSVCGFISKLAFGHRVDGISVWLYVVLGITQGLAMLSLMFLIPTLATIYVIAGGVCYLSGTYFLVSDIRRFRFHTIWHILVLAGCAFHYFAIFHSLQA